ncbi:uncharacterized protein [Drosophila virilis]
MQRACDAAMVRKKKGGNKHKPVRWWNGEIEDVRNRCHTARRIYQRDGKQQTWPWSTKPKKLAQPTTPGELCSPRLSSEASGNAGPTRYPAFGQAYKTVMSKLARGPVPTCPEHLKQIVETLLPRQIELAHNPPAVGTSVVLPIDTEDISATLKRPAYRPLCMLDSTGKLFERIICDRLKKEIADRYGLSDQQFGFRKHRSTVVAIKLVADTAGKAI